MNGIKNIVIVGKKDYTLAIDFKEVMDPSPNCVYYDSNQLPLSANASGSTAMNSLYTICIHLEKLKASKKANTLSNVVYMIIPDIVYDKISKETYKGWVVNKKFSNGKELGALELSLWSKFMDLYQEVFGYVVSKPLSRYNIKKPKYNAELVHYISSLITLCWESIAQHELETVGMVLDFKDASENVSAQQ